MFYQSHIPVGDWGGNLARRRALFLYLAVNLQQDSLGAVPRTALPGCFKNSCVIYIKGWWGIFVIEWPTIINSIL